MPDRDEGRSIRMWRIGILIGAVVAVLGLVYLLFNGQVGGTDVIGPESPDWVEGLEDLDVRPATVLIPAGGAGEWDEHFREIGNIVRSPQEDAFLLFYSAYQGRYRQDNVFVGAARSRDGTTWEKLGRILDLPSEDPYTVVHDSSYYLFFEDKEDALDRGVSLATSRDGRTWQVIKRYVLAQTIFGWQNRDASSPLVTRQGDRWVMLYEGRGAFNEGRIGYAVSDDLITWRKSSRPVFAGGSDWDRYVVPDDLIESEGTYVLTYHGITPGMDWQSGLALSFDLRHWSAVSLHPFTRVTTVMLWLRGEVPALVLEHDDSIQLLTLEGSSR